MRKLYLFGKKAVIVGMAATLALGGIACGGSMKEAAEQVAVTKPSYSFTTGSTSNGMAMDSYVKTEGFFAESSKDYSTSYDPEYGMMEMPGSVAGGAGTEEEYLALLEQAGRKTIRTANLEVETLEFDKFVEQFQTQVDALGGYMEYANVYNNGYNYSYYNGGYYGSRRSANYTVRIPQVNLDRFLNTVGEFSNVTNKTLREQDVTLDYVDTQSHIATLQVEQERLLELLKEAKDLDAIIMLESRLSSVRYQIESYTSRLRTYDNQITYSTVSVNVSEVVRVTQKDPETLGERIANGWQDTMYEIKDGAQDFFVWLVVNIPYLVFWAAVILIVVMVIRKKVKKTKAKKAERAKNAAAEKEEELNKD